MTDREQKITYDAPVAPVDLLAFDDNGEPYVIWPCSECLPWHAEAVQGEDGTLLIREWHAVGCAAFQSMIGSR